MAGRHVLRLALLMACGCSMADYEARMDKNAQRLKIFDEENKYLGDMLELPTPVSLKDKVVVPGLPVELYLRPPKEVASRPKENELPFGLASTPLFRYPGPPGFNVFITAAKIQEKGEPKDGVPTSEFGNRVLAGVRDFYKREFKASDIPFKTQTLPELTKPIDPLVTPIEVDHVPIFDNLKPPSNISIYFYQRGMYQAAVLYFYPSEKRDEFKKSIDMSIATLALDDEAQKRKAEFQKRRR